MQVQLFLKGLRITDHRIGNQVQRRIPTVSDYRVRQMRDRGLRAIPAKLDKSPYARFSGRDSKHMVCEQADNKADVVPCNRLPIRITT